MRFLCICTNFDFCDFSAKLLEFPYCRYRELTDDKKAVPDTLEEEEEDEDVDEKETARVRYRDRYRSKKDNATSTPDPANNKTRRLILVTCFRK